MYIYVYIVHIYIVICIYMYILYIYILCSIFLFVIPISAYLSTRFRRNSSGCTAVFQREAGAANSCTRPSGQSDRLRPDSTPYGRSQPLRGRGYPAHSLRSRRRRQRNLRTGGRQRHRCQTGQCGQSRRSVRLFESLRED